MVARVSSELSISPAVLRFVRLGQSQSLSELLRDWHPRVVSLANKLAPSQHDIRADCIAAGNAAIWEAACNIDPGAIDQFPAYATRAIRNRMVDVIRQHKIVQTHQRYMGDCATAPEPAYVDEDALELADAKSKVQAWLGTLGDRERRVLCGIYYDQKSQRDLAVELGVTVARVSQLHRQLLDAGRRVLGSEAN